MALKDWFTKTAAPTKPADWQDGYQMPVKPAQDVVAAPTRPSADFRPADPQPRDVGPLRSRAEAVTGPPGAQQQTATPSAFAMRIAARCQHTRRRIAFICDVLPDQSLKVVRAERVKVAEAGDDGAGTVVYDGPLAMGPDCRCPYCDANTLFLCRKCSSYSCHAGGTETCICPSCGSAGKIVPTKEFKVEVGAERQGGGDYIALPGRQLQRIRADRRHVVVHNPNNKLF